MPLRLVLDYDLREIVKMVCIIDNKQPVCTGVIIAVPQFLIWQFHE